MGCKKSNQHGLCLFCPTWVSGPWDLLVVPNLLVADVVHLPQRVSLHLRHPQLNQSHVRLKVRQTPGQGASNLFTKVIREGAGPASVSSQPKVTLKKLNDLAKY